MYGWNYTNSNNIYFDNLIAGSESTAEALKYYSEALSIFKVASFSLQSWTSCHPCLIDRAILDGVADTSPLTKVLGFLWDRLNNTLQLPLVCLSPLCSPTATKRDLLSGISSIYDPLGINFTYFYISKDSDTRYMEAFTRLGRTPTSSSFWPMGEV